MISSSCFAVLSFDIVINAILTLAKAISYTEGLANEPLTLKALFNIILSFYLTNYFLT